MFSAFAPGEPYSAVMGVHAGSPMTAWHASAAAELGLPRLYELDEVVASFESAGSQVSVARLRMGFVPISSRRGGHEHRRNLTGWLDHDERDEVVLRFGRPGIS